MSQLAVFHRLSDSELWNQVCLGSEQAFEVAIERYQTLICTVAYNICGDLVLSEDVAQETFWAAWRTRLALAEPGKLKAWLCGIARNLALQAGARNGRSAGTSEVAVSDREAETADPAQVAVSREEGQLVWQTLQQIPETYREPLLLYYREQQSITDVARALDLTEETVRQRLSRGRALLRDQMADLVAGVLSRTRPTRGFTLAVLAGAGMTATGTHTALAGAAVVGTSGVAAGTSAGPTALAGGAVSAGLVGSFLGALGGLAGGWVGFWLPAQVAATRAERTLLMRVGTRLLCGSLIFLALMLLLAWWGLPALDGFAKFAAWGGLLAVYVLFVIVETSGLILTLRRWRVNPGPNLEPNETRLRTALQRTVRQYRGRVYTSHWKMFGWPIIDCQVSDPQLSQPGDRQTRHRQPPRVARGWIAVGDEAVGLLLAIGGRARGFVAIGGRAVGVIALGGVAFGGLALGGCAAGVLAFGGLCCGGVALGGVALGWQAVGGAACAWDTAVGGLAIARNAAAGGVAVAAELAYGGAAWARHGNDELARSALTNHPYLAGLAWYHLHLKSVTALVVILSVLPNFMMWGAMYRREPSANNQA